MEFQYLANRRVRIGLFVLFQGLYALTSSGNAFRIPDEFEVYFQAEHLVDAGDLSIPQAQEIRQSVVVNGKVVGTQSMFFGKVGLDGKPYAPYGPLAAVLLVPHHVAGRALASLVGIERVPRAQGLAWVIVVGGITMLATATAAALTVVGFHRAAMAIGTPAPMALLLSLILGGATVLWPYGTSLFSEGFLAAAFSALSRTTVSATECCRRCAEENPSASWSLSVSSPSTGRESTKPASARWMSVSWQRAVRASFAALQPSSACRSTRANASRTTPRCFRRGTAADDILSPAR